MKLKMLILYALMLWVSLGISAQTDEEIPPLLKQSAVNEHHKHLEKMMGHWDVKGRIWFAPNAPAINVVSQSHITMIMDGRFLHENFTNASTGYKSVTLIGYDNIRKQYNSIWLETLDTRMRFSTGSCDDAGNVFSFHGEHQDAQTGEMRKFKWGIDIVDKNTIHFTSFEISHDGKEFQTIDVTYSRKKEKSEK